MSTAVKLPAEMLEAGRFAEVDRKDGKKEILPTLDNGSFEARVFYVETYRITEHQIVLPCTLKPKRSATYME